MALSIDGPTLLDWWQRLAGLPTGKRIFARLIYFAVPYSGSIGARIQELRPGYAKLVLHDRRRVRNHLRSIHAVALTNLGELSSGLALLTSLPPNTRAIAVGLNISFQKKARGTLIAEGIASLPEIENDIEHEVRAVIRDEAGDVVAETRVRWRLGLRK